MSSSSFQIGKTIINVGGDVGEFITKNPGELFTQVDLSSWDVDYIPPLIATSIIHLLKKERLIIIGGDYGFDKGSLLRFIAKEFSANSKSDVFDWSGAKERQSFFSVLNNGKAGIYIMVQLQPHYISYNLQELVKIASQKKLYFLISTDTPLNAWQLSMAEQKKHWINIDASNISYNPTLIQVELVKELNKNISGIQFSNGVKKINRSTVLPGGTLAQLSQSLSSPEQVKLFVKRLTDVRGIVDFDEIKDCLTKTISRQDTLIHKWFHSLTEFEQYVALSMVIFSDLYDDQFFGVVNKLSEAEWKHSHDGLKSLDYINIERLFNFFDYDLIDGNERLIRSKYPNQRMELFKSAWNSHRRHIKMTLNTGVRLVIESNNSGYQNSELFGNRKKRRALRITVSNFISDLGWLSKNLIEEHLLILASQDVLSSQNVAARAIAKWREIPGGDKRLFDLLTDWQESSKLLLAIDQLIKERENSSTSAAYIRATIILTIRNAAKFDAPDHLSKELVELLLTFLDDSNVLVRNRFIQTIPEIIRQHAAQFTKPVQLSGKKSSPLSLLLKYDDLIYPISIGMALAYLDSPKKADAILSSRLTYCQSNLSLSSKNGLSDRDKIIAMIILAIGKICEWNGLTFTIGNRDIYDILDSLRKRETNSNLKDLIVHVLINQITRAHNDIKLLKIIVPALNAKERDQIVDAFTRKYLEERKNLRGGDRSFRQNNIRYDTWLHSPRPFMDVEKAMFDWLQSNSKELRQMATLTFIKFSEALEYEENKFKEDFLNREEEVKESEVDVAFKSPIIYGNFSVITAIYKFFMKTYVSKPAAKIIDDALPVMSKSHLLNRGHHKLVIDKWKRKTGNIQDAAESIGRLTGLNKTQSDLIQILKTIFLRITNKLRTKIFGP